MARAKASMCVRRGRSRATRSAAARGTESFTRTHTDGILRRTKGTRGHAAHNQKDASIKEPKSKGVHYARERNLDMSCSLLALFL